jgi:PEP-CTERM motif
MLHKISILTLFAFAAAIVAVAPARADGLPAHVMSGDLGEGSSNDTDRIPDHRRDMHIGENFMLNVDKFSTFERDVFEDEDSDSGHSKHGFSGVPNTAEWIWWLNHSDKDKKESGKNPVGDAPIATPEPTTLFLLGLGLLALGAWRRRGNHSALIS